MRYLLFGVSLLAVAAVSVAQTSSRNDLEKNASDLSREFVNKLKPQLKNAMASGGPSHAIEVCATVAPRIADALSAESGWLVKRVSLRSRNASRAVPDSWEREVLRQFDDRQSAGENPADMRFGEVSGGQYRYLQAQAVEPICLVCHGTELSEPVRKTLEQYYPDDWATGYSLGQVRGAISLTRKLSQ